MKKCGRTKLRSVIKGRVYNKIKSWFSKGRKETTNRFWILSFKQKIEAVKKKTMTK